MCQIFPDIVSDSLHLTKNCPPETMCRNSPPGASPLHHLHLHPLRELAGRIYPAPKPSTDISLKMRLTAQKISKCQNRHDFCRPETMSGESVPSSFCFLLSLEAGHTNKQTHTHTHTNWHTLFVNFLALRQEVKIAKIVEKCIKKIALDSTKCLLWFWVK